MQTEEWQRTEMWRAEGKKEKGGGIKWNTDKNQREGRMEQRTEGREAKRETERERDRRNRDRQRQRMQRTEREKEWNIGQRAVYMEGRKREKERERERRREREREQRVGWVLACLSVGGGVKLNYPLVLRPPGTFAGALALSVLLRQGYARL